LSRYRDTDGIWRWLEQNKEADPHIVMLQVSSWMQIVAHASEDLRRRLLRGNLQQLVLYSGVGNTCATCEFPITLRHLYIVHRDGIVPLSPSAPLPMRLRSLVLDTNRPSQAVVDLCRASCDHLEALIMVSVVPTVAIGFVCIIM
jgi:hypothetical protein